jgi:predicted AAA+ superfamily ATPase
MIEKDVLKFVIKEQNKNLKIDNFVLRKKIKELKDNLKNDFIILISGIRRSGKSTILDILKKDYKNYNYLNFDDERLINFEVSDFEKLEDCFLELYGENNIFFFDEIQNIKNWERFVRRLHNSKKKIIITGSNSNLLSKEMGTHLTGRNLSFELYPYSFKEFLDFKNFQIEKNDFYDKIKLIKLIKLFDNFVKFGGMPEFLNNKNNTNYFKNLYENILYKDIIVRYNLSKNEKILKELVYFLFSNISKQMSYNSLKNMLNLSNSITIKEYINYLQEVFLIFEINKFDYSLKKQLINPKKIYSIDNGLTNSISFKFSENFGRQIENIVFLHFKRISKYEIFYHKNKFECDFLLKEKDKIVKAIQVCKILNLENEKRELGGIVESCKMYNLKKGLILIYEGDEKNFIKEGIKIEIKLIYKYLLN